MDPASIGAGMAGANFGLGLAEMGVSAGINAAAASKAHDRMKNMMTRGPTYQMIGLRDAGLNPILAATNGGKLGGSAASVAQAHAASQGKDHNKSMMAGIQADLMKNQSSAHAATAQSATNQAGVLALQADALRYDNVEKRINAEFFETEKGRELIRLGIINRMTPNTWSGITSNLGYGLTQADPVSPIHQALEQLNVPQKYKDLFYQLFSSKVQPHNTDWKTNGKNKNRHGASGSY